MIRWIVDASLKARIPIIVITAALMFVGYNDVREMPVDTLPEFGETTVEIQTEALGLSAAEVEQLITIPMEQDLLNGVAWLQVIRSKSVPGLSSIELIFEPGTDPFRARLAVQERVSQAKVALPGVSSPPQMLQPLSSTNRVMIVGLSSSDLSPIEMSVLARWTIRPRLMGVPGVANVSIWGQRERQLQVLVDPAQLQQRSVSLGQVVETAANALWVSPLTYVEASSPGTSGFFETPNQRIGIQHILPIESPEDLAKVNVEETNLTLGDVAQVVEDHQPLIGDAVLGDGPGLLLVIEKFPEANTIDTNRGIEEAIDTLRPGLSGMAFDTSVFRPATSIQRGLDDLEVAAVVALVIAMLVIGLLFFRWRTALIALVAIPVSVMAAMILLNVLGQTLNVIVLVGLVAAIGLVIDDVVTSTQNVSRRLRHQQPEGVRKSTADIVIEASLEVRGSLIFSALIVGAPAAAAFFLEGLAGEFFPPMATAYLLAVLTSTAVALTVTPALSMALFSVAPPNPGEPPIGRWLNQRYGGLLSRCLRLPRPFVLAAVGLLVLTVVATVPLLNRPSLLPSFREDQLLIQLGGAPGTSLPEMNRIANAVGNELRSIPGVSNVGGHVGRAIMSDQLVNANSGELWVTIDPGADYDTTIEAIHEAVGGYPGLSRSIVSYSDEKVREAQERPGQDITLRVFGEDLGVLRTKAEELKQVISGIDGVTDARVDLPPEEPTVEIQVDLEAAQRAGIEPGGVRRASAAVLQGIVVGSFFEHEKVFEVVVRGTPETRESLTSISELLIDTPGGGQVRLADVADVRIAPNPSVIERDSVSRRIDVTANVTGRSRGAVVGDIEQAIRNFDFPLEYHATVLKSEKENSWDRLLLFAAVAAIAILLLLQATFASWRLAALAFFTLPTALLGGLIAALLSGGDITIGSYAGFLTLFGIATRGAILLINRYQSLRLQADEPTGEGLILEGAQERITPVLMTALALGLGLLALMLLGDPFGHEVAEPMALVIIGGLVTSTLFNLFILPAVYLHFAPEPEPAESRTQFSISQGEVPA